MPAVRLSLEESVEIDSGRSLTGVRGESWSSGLVGRGLWRMEYLDEPI